MIEKPDWKDAPEWANWLAQDADGAWYWHGDEPVCTRKGWYSEKVERIMADNVGPKEPRPKQESRVHEYKILMGQSLVCPSGCVMALGCGFSHEEGVFVNVRVEI